MSKPSVTKYVLGRLVAGYQQDEIDSDFKTWLSENNICELGDLDGIKSTAESIVSDLESIKEEAISALYDANELVDDINDMKS